MGYKESENPLPKSGLANYLLVMASKKGRKVEYEAKRYDFLLWRYNKKYWSKGHIEGIDSVGKGGNVWTIAANTNCKSSEDPREGGCICRKKRNYKHPLGRMKYSAIVGIVNKKYSTNSECTYK